MSISIYWLIVAAIVGLGLGFGLAYTIRVRIAQKKVDEQYYSDLQQLKQEKDKLNQEIDILRANKETNEYAFYQRRESIEKQIQEEQNKWQERQIAVKEQEAKKQALLEAIDDLKRTYQATAEAGKQAAKDVEITAMSAAAENIERRVKELEQEYTDYETKYRDDMIAMMQEAVKKYQDITLNAQQESDHALETLQDLRSRIDVIVDTNKRAAQEESKKDFYRLQLSAEDIEEIAKLRSVERYLRSAEPLNKVIWKVYYEKPYNDLIGRVIGTTKKMGIYKITNLKNNMCYVGQSVDIAERWKQHIKRGVGADTPTRNKLYPAMLADGVENFTFELLEECTARQLNEREDYWQEVYHARDFGYSIK